MHGVTFFIVGVPRSGTTLISVILNNHSQIFVDKNAIAKRILSCRDRCYENFDFEKKGGHWVEQIRKDERLISFFNPSVISGVSSLAEYFSDGLLRRAQEKGKSIVGDKSPDALEDLDSLLAIFPSAKIIHLVRDPRPNVFSLVTRQYMDLQLAALKWKDWNTRALNHLDWLGKNRIHILKYEDLVNQPRDTVQTLCEFLGVAFEEQMLDIKRNEEVKRENSYVAAEIDKMKNDRWQIRFNDREIRKIESIVGSSVMRSFGYASKFLVLKSAAFSHRRRFWLEFKQTFRALFRGRRKVMMERKVVTIEVPIKDRIKKVISVLVFGIFNSKFFR